MCFFDSTDKQLNTQIKKIHAVVMGGSLNAVNVIDEIDPFFVTEFTEVCLGCQREITQIDVLFHNSLCWDCESSGKGLDNLSIYPYSLVSTVFNNGVAVKIEAVQPVGLSVYNTAIYQEAIAFQAAHESDKSEPIGSLSEAANKSTFWGFPETFNCSGQGWAFENGQLTVNSDCATSEYVLMLPHFVPYVGFYYWTGKEITIDITKAKVYSSYAKAANAAKRVKSCAGLVVDSLGTQEIYYKALHIAKTLVNSDLLQSFEALGIKLDFPTPANMLCMFERHNITVAYVFLSPTHNYWSLRLMRREGIALEGDLSQDWLRMVHDFIVSNYI